MEILTIGHAPAVVKHDRNRLTDRVRLHLVEHGLGVWEKIPGGPTKEKEYEFHFFSFAALRRTPRPGQVLGIPAKSKRTDLAE
jgi:hypothetical protein